MLYPISLFKLTCPSTGNNTFPTIGPYGSIPSFENPAQGVGVINGYINSVKGDLAKLLCFLFSHQSQMLNAEGRLNNNPFISLGLKAIFRLADLLKMLAEYYVKAYRQVEESGGTITISGNALTAEQLKEKAQTYFNRARSLFEALQSSAVTNISDFSFDSGSTSQLGSGDWLSEALSFANALPNGQLSTIRVGPTGQQVSMNDAITARLSAIGLAVNDLERGLSREDVRNLFIAYSSGYRSTHELAITIENCLKWAEGMADGNASEAQEVITQLVTNNKITYPVNLAQLMGSGYNPSEVYSRLLLALARAYEKVGQREAALHILNVILGQENRSSLSQVHSNLDISGMNIIIPGTGTSTSLWIRIARIYESWTVQGNTQQYIAHLRKALEIAVAHQSESPIFREIMDEAIPSLVRQLIEVDNSEASIKSAIETIILVYDYSEKATDLKWALYELKDHYFSSNYEYILKLALQYNLGEVVRDILAQQVNSLGQRNPASLRYRQALAYILKIGLDGSVGDDPQWSQITPYELTRFEGITFDSQDIPPSRGLTDRIWLASLLWGMGEEFKPLAQAEYRTCEIQAVNNVTAHPNLANFLDLANIYYNIGAAASDLGDEELAEQSYRRAATIYRAIFYGRRSSSNWQGADENDPSFAALTIDNVEILQDISNLLPELFSHCANHLPPQGARVKAYLQMAGAVCPTEMDYEERSLEEMQRWHDLLVDIYTNKVQASSQATNEQKLAAAAGLLDADRALAEEFIDNNMFEEALNVFKTNIANIFLTLPADTPQNADRRSLAMVMGLGNILELCWALSERGDFAIREERYADAKYDNLIAVVIYNALVYGDPDRLDGSLLPAGFSNSLPAEYQDIVQIILDNRDKFLDENILRKDKVTLATLHINLANHLKAAGRLDVALLQEALIEFDLVPTLTPTEKDLAEANIGKCETLIWIFKNTWQSSTAEANQAALAEIESLAVQNFNELILTSDSKLKKSMLKALFAYTWFLQVRGSYLRTQGQLTEAYADFEHARALLSALLYGLDDPNNPEITMIAGRADELQRLIPRLKRTLTEVHLDLANLLNALVPSHDRPEHRMQTIQAALNEFGLMGITEETLEGSSDLPPLSPRKKIDALIGFTETLIHLGDFIAQTGSADEAVSKYQKAIDILQNLLEGDLSDLTKFKVQSNLAWALSRLADIRERLGFETEAQTLRSRVLDIYQGFLSNPDLPGLLSEAGQTLNDIRASHLAVFAQVNPEAALTLGQGFLVDQPAAAEVRFEIRILMILADTICWEMDDRIDYEELLSTAEKYYSRVLALAQQFQLNDSEMQNIIFDASLGLGHVLSELGREDEALELLLPLTEQSTDSLRRTRLYLSLGDIYNYKKRNKQKAQQYYQQVFEIVEASSDLGPLLSARARAQAYLGIGNIQLLINEDPQAALQNYQSGMALLAGRTDLESRSILAELHLSSASANSRLGHDNQASALIGQAAALASGNPALLERISEEYPNLWINQENTGITPSVSVAYQEGTYGESTSEHGWTLSAGFGNQFHLAPALTLNLDAGITYGMVERSQEFHDYASGEEKLRLLSNQSLALDLGATLAYKYNFMALNTPADLTLRVRPFGSYHYFPFTTYDYSQDEPAEPSSLSSLQFGANLSLGLGFMFGSNNNIRLGLNLDAGVSGLWGFGDNPMREAQMQSYDESIANLEHDLDDNPTTMFETSSGNSWIIDEDHNGLHDAIDQDGDGIDDRQENLERLQGERAALRDEQLELFSAFVNPSLSLSFSTFSAGSVIFKNTSLSVGFRWAYDPINITNYGFYQLNNQDPERMAATFGLSSTLFFGRDSRWSIPFSFSGEAGDYLFLKAMLGLHYHFDTWSLGLDLFSTYFDDFNLIRSWSLGLLVGPRF